MLSILTPLHAPYERYIRDCYESFREQAGWEWIVVENAGGRLPADICQDPQVKVVRADDEVGANSIGRLKALAASYAAGDILVELDADDLLTPDALETIRTAFADPSVAMAYSNSAHFDDEWRSSGYSDYYGWRSRPFFFQGHELIEMIAFPCNAEMMRRIEWAPNHVRAWRRAAYEKVGGHNPALKVGDDHDLCCRFFVAYGPKAIRHIDRCLYLYRTHKANSCNLYNAEVQAQTDRNYREYSRRLALRQAQDDGLALLDLGGRLNAWPGFTTVDRFGADVNTDLNGAWPFEDNSVGVLHASHIFEHLRDPVHTMNEAYRVLAPGGWLLLEVPSTDGRGAWQDPTHVSFWNANSLFYYTDRNWSRFIPDYHGRFQLARSVTWFPTEFERVHNIAILQADLIALKGQRQAGEMRI